MCMPKNRKFTFDRIIKKVFKYSGLWGEEVIDDYLKLCEQYGDDVESLANLKPKKSVKKTRKVKR